VTTLLNVVRERTYMFVLGLSVVLLVANIIVLPAFAYPSQIPATLGTLAPLGIVGMASTPAFLSGGGGVDLSLAPLMGLVNIVMVTQLLNTDLGSPLIAVPIVLALGGAVGAVNGAIVTILRFPPVIATLCSFFVLAGVSLKLVPTPVTARPNWTDSLAGSIGPVPGALVTIGAPLVLWLWLQRTAFHETLLSVGDNDATAFSAGVNVIAVRIWAYALGGLIAAVAGIALTGLVRTADANLTGTFVLAAIAAVALGGSNLGGGRGGLVGSLLGAASIFLLKNFLTAVGVSAFWFQAVYGAVLLFALLVGAQLLRRPIQAGAS